MKSKTSGKQTSQFFKKGLLLIILFTNFYNFGLNAQTINKTAKNKNTIHMRIWDNNENSYSGIYYNLIDTFIYIIKPNENIDTIYKFKYSDINLIEYKKEGSFLKGFRTGFGVSTGFSLITALAGAQNSFLGPVADFIILETIIGIPVSTTSGLISSYRGRKRYMHIENKYSEFETLSKFLKNEKPYSSSNKVILIKNNTKESTPIKNQFNKPVDEKKDSIMPENLTPLVSDPLQNKNNKTKYSNDDPSAPSRFHVKVGVGKKYSNVKSKITKDIEALGYNYTEWNTTKLKSTTLDLAYQPNNNFRFGLNFHTNYHFVDLHKFQYLGDNNNIAYINVSANSKEYIVYSEYILNTITNIHPKGWELSARAGLLISNNYYNLSMSGDIDGNWYSPENSFFSEYPHLRFGLNTQITLEYYFYKNFSINLGTTANLRPSYQYPNMTFAPSGYSKITVESLKINQSTVSIFAGIGIHF